MKILILLGSIYVAPYDCYNIPEIETNHYNINFVIKNSIKEAIVYDKENDTDDLLLNSILRSLHPEHPVLLIRDDASKEKDARMGSLNKRPKTVIITKTLDEKDLKSAMFKSLLVSHWSPLYLVTTSRRENETCVNGTFEPDYFQKMQNYMNLLWHKFKISRATVSFPVTCPEHFVIYGEKISSSIGEIYDRGIKVINPRDRDEFVSAVVASGDALTLAEGYPVRANIFYRFPTSITDCGHISNYINVDIQNSFNFCGVDGLVLNDFSRHFKFNLTAPAVKNKDCNSYGSVDAESHVASGSLDCIVRKKVDISFNSRFLMQYSNVKFLYLHYIITDSLCVITKSPEMVPLWHYGMNTFSPRESAVLFTSMFTLGVLTWLMALRRQTLYGEKPFKLRVYIINAVASTLFGFCTRKAFKTKYRLLIGTSLLCAIPLMAMFQGSVSYQFTTQRVYKYIDSLNELYDSELTLYTSPSIKNLLVTDEEIFESHRENYLRNKLKIANFEFNELLEQPNLGTLERKADFMIRALLNYSDANGLPLFYVMDECLGDYYLSYIARADFLFLEETVQFMMRVLEAGLPTKYYRWTRRTFQLGDTNPPLGAHPRPFEPNSLSDLRVSFIFLLIGYFVSITMLLVEIRQAKRQKTNGNTIRFILSEKNKKISGIH